MNAQSDTQPQAPDASARPTEKRVATLRARAALVGAQLIESRSDDGRLELILTRWSLTRAFRDNELVGLERTLDRMGAPA